MDLFVWPSAEGIESFDSDCLVVLTYLRLGRCPINLNTTLCVDKSAFHNIPLLVHGSNEVKGVYQIIEYLRKENYGLEYGLSDEELSMLESLVASVERRITPACRWLLWADSNVYKFYTSTLYRSCLPYFQGLWYSRRWRGQLTTDAEFSQLALCTNHTSRNRHRDIETTLYEGARRCLTALSYVLGEKQFFLGEKPSAVDAYVFARLWPLLHYDRVWRAGEREATATPHRLVSHVYQCENLLHLCRRVQRLCFPSAINTMRSSANESMVDVDDDLFPVSSVAKRVRAFFSVLTSPFAAAAKLLPACLVPHRDTLVFGALVLGVFGIYAVGSGLVRFVEDEGEDDGEGNAELMDLLNEED